MGLETHAVVQGSECSQEVYDMIAFNKQSELIPQETAEQAGYKTEFWCMTQGIQWKT